MPSAVTDEPRTNASTDRLRRAVGVVGELMITAGVVVALFAVYTLVWTGVETSSAQDALEAEFEALGESVPQAPREGASEQTDADPQTEPLPGDAYARLRIPRLGEDWQWIVVEGVDLATLTRGPGHYPDSADPGEIGNTAIAGHRATYGEPFAYLDRLVAGDEIVVERGGMEYRYTVTESFVTVPADVDVLAPVPGQPGAQPARSAITLTTCHPRWGSTERLVVHGTLADSTPVERGG
jgi:sortase A